MNTLTIEIVLDPRFHKAISLLNTMTRLRLHEYRTLCKKYPQFAQVTELPEGDISKGGLIQEVELMEWMLNPDGRGKSLADKLKPEPTLETTAGHTNIVMVMTEPWVTENDTQG